MIVHRDGVKDLELIEKCASVGMLAKEAERFRRTEDVGSSGAPEPTSQRNGARLRNYNPLVTSARLLGGTGVVERELEARGAKQSRVGHGAAIVRDSLS